MRMKRCQVPLFKKHGERAHFELKKEPLLIAFGINIMRQKY